MGNSTKFQIKPSENQVLAAVANYLKLRGVFFWRTNNIPVYDKTRGAFRSMPEFSRKGVPDIIAIVKGQFVGLEMKRPDGRQSADQKQFEEDVVKAGGRYFVIKSIDDIRDAGF
jgi:hypothetical protein